MKGDKKDLIKIEVKSRTELRKWLKANHAKSSSIWLVTFKKSKIQWYLDYDSIVEEALCFGWVDSLPRALDKDRKMLRLSPRNPKSAWSKVNRDRVAKLIKTKLMTDAGLAAINAAKKNGSWSKLKEVDSGKIPPDLVREFKKYSHAKTHFEKFPPSSKRAILEWIALAKTEQTRLKRVSQTAKLAQKNIRANHYRQPNLIAFNLKRDHS